MRPVKLLRLDRIDWTKLYWYDQLLSKNRYNIAIFSHGYAIFSYIVIFSHGYAIFSYIATVWPENLTVNLI